MAGDTLMPLLITHRKRTENELSETGLREGDDYMIRYQKNCFITKEIFNEYIETVLFPYIKKIRENPLFSNERAVILCDNCSSHVSEEISKK